MSNDLKFEETIMVSRGVQADLDSVTSYMYMGKESSPEGDTGNWNEGKTWYPFAELKSGHRIPDNLIEAAEGAAKFANRWVILRGYYVQKLKITDGYYKDIYLPPSDIIKPTVRFSSK